MSNYEQRPDSGVLFKNDKKGNEKAPDYTGDYTTQDGNKRRIAAWIKESKIGGKYMSLSFSDMRRQEPKDDPAPQETAEHGGGGFDDVPFAPIDWRAS